LQNKKARPNKRLKDIWENSPTIRNILKVSIGDITSKVFSFATVFLLIRGLSISDYATYTIFSGISFLFSGIVGAGINIALIRFTSDHLSRKKEKPLALYTLGISFELLVYALVAGLCLLFPKQSTLLLFGQQAPALPLQLGIVAGFGMLMLQFARSLYQAEEKFNNYIATLWLVQVLIFVSLGLLWALQLLSFVPVAIIFATVQLGTGFWLLANYLRNLQPSNLKNLFLDQKTTLKRFLISSGWLIGYFLVLNLFSRMDVLMLMRFKGKEELAIYAVAFQFYSLSLLFLGSIHAVLLPKFSKSDMQNSVKQRAFLKKWLQVSVWLIIPIILFDWLGNPIFVWLNGDIYEKSFSIFIIFSVGIWLSMMFSPLVNIIISRGELRFLFTVSVLGLIFNLASNLLLIPMMGGAGAAIVIVLTQNVFIQIPILFRGLRE
jgi:O-antigen/teichoic acid export membrane protein